MLGKLTKAVQGVKPLEAAQNQLPEALKYKLPSTTGKRDSQASKESVNYKTVETVKENPREVVNEKPPIEKKPRVINEKPPKPARESLPEEKILNLSRTAAAVLSTDNARTHSHYKPVATRPDQRGRLERCCMCCASCYRENGFCTFRKACFAACIFLMLIGLAKLITCLLVWGNSPSVFAKFLEPMLFFVVDSPEKARRFSSVVAPVTAFVYDLIPAILILFGALRYSETSCILFTSMMIIGTTVAFLQAFFITLYVIIKQVACIKEGIECSGDRNNTRELSAAAFVAYILTGIRLHFLKCSLGFSHEIRNGLYENTRGEPTKTETQRSFVPTGSEKTDAESPPPFANNDAQEVAKLSATYAPNKTSIPTSEGSGPMASEETRMSNDSDNQAQSRGGSVGFVATGTSGLAVSRQPSNIVIKAKKSKGSTAKVLAATRDSKVHPK